MGPFTLYSQDKKRANPLRKRRAVGSVLPFLLEIYQLYSNSSPSYIPRADDRWRDSWWPSSTSWRCLTPWLRTCGAAGPWDPRIGAPSAGCESAGSPQSTRSGRCGWKPEEWNDRRLDTCLVQLRLILCLVGLTRLLACRCSRLIHISASLSLFSLLYFLDCTTWPTFFAFSTLNGKTIFPNQTGWHV